MASRRALGRPLSAGGASCFAPQETRGPYSPIWPHRCARPSACGSVAPSGPDTLVGFGVAASRQRQLGQSAVTSPSPAGGRPSKAPAPSGAGGHPFDPTHAERITATMTEQARSPWIALYVLCLGSLMIVLDV